MNAAKRILVSIFVGFVFFNHSAYASTHYNSIYSVHWGHSTLSIASREPLNAHVFTLHSPYRVVIDLPAVVMHQSIPFIQSSSAMTLRSRLNKDHRLRLVVDDAQHLVMHKKISDSDGHTLTQWIFEDPRTMQANTFYSAYDSGKLSGQSTSVKKEVPRKVVIVIDPGHGGKDPGAIGLGGVYEKNIVLSISKKLAHYINAQPGLKAVLTRSADRYLTLRDRLARARRFHPDLFIAIHADAYSNARSSGASVFALSLRGATSEAARWLAAKENASELVGGVTLNNKSELLKSVLLNLSQTATIQASLRMGSDILSALRQVTHLHRQRVEQAAFVVLKSPDIPSLLIETGFVSNDHDQRRLLDSSAQWQLAVAIGNGIRKSTLHMKRVAS